MLIAQISDPHIVAPGRLLYRQIDTAAALRAAVARLAALRPAADLVVVSGDLVNGGRGAEYAHLRQCLAPLSMPIYLLPGNHDDRRELAAACPEQRFAGAPLCCQRVDVDDLTLLLLDTVIAGEEGGEIAAAQIAWLDAACPAARPVVVFMHHPPFVTGIAGMDALRLAGADLLAVWLKGRDNIRAIACGHVHRAVFTAFAGVPTLIAPSPAHQIALDLGGDPAALAWTLEPGGLLLHRWDGECLVSHVLPVAAAAVTPYG